ncbi:ABC transporter permease [Actinomadura kijaniata]|uniref:ABC transporter permease n=1 Tax=Actinomadura kijaniata TaxID=46161 RepID=UPI00082A87D5|nr:ABC transporter permease [Actinomadura kijaniata]
MTAVRVFAAAVRAVAVLFAVSVAVFAATELLPSDAAQVRSGGVPAAEIRERLGLDRPAWQRYGIWLAGLARGDAGSSLVTDRPVARTVAERLPATLTLAGCALAVAVPLTLALAWAAGTASRRRGPVITLVTVLAAVPQAVFAAGLVAVFAGMLAWLPPVSLVPADGSPLERPEILVLPALALAVPSAAFGAGVLGGAVADAVRAPHVTSAAERGVPRVRVAARHVLPYLAAPVVRVLAVMSGGMLAATTVVETLFGYSGLGELLVSAIGVRDVPVVQAVALPAAAVVLAGLFAADVLAALTERRRAA